MDATARRTARSELHALPGHLLWRAAARVTRELDGILPGRADIHAYATLAALADEEPQSQRGLSRVTAVSGTTLTAVAHALQRDGLVERVRNPEDRRSYSLTRTAAGRAAVATWEPDVVRLEERLTSALTTQEAERLREVLRGMVAETLDEHTPRVLTASTGFLVTKAHQRAHREFVDVLSPLGIEPRHFGTLRVLRVVGSAVQGDVADLLEVSPATVVQIVDDLEARGLVVRERDPADRRAYHLGLRDGALEVIDEAAACSESVLAPLLGGPRSRARRDLVRLLPLLLGAS